MQDPDLKGMEYWNSSRKNTSSGSRTTKEEVEKINRWLEKSSRFDNFDIRTLDSKVHLAILALYDITIELEVESAVKPALAYEYLIKRYKQVSAGSSQSCKTHFEKCPLR